MKTAVDVLKQAQDFAFGGEYTKAKAFCKAVIERVPGTTYAKDAEEKLRTYKQMEADVIDFSDLFKAEGLPTD